MFQTWILDLCLTCDDWDKMIEYIWHGGGISGIKPVHGLWDDYVML